MGRFREFFTGATPVTDFAADPQKNIPNFAVDQDSIPPEIFGYASYAELIPVAPRIDRKSAMSVPAVKRCRDLIAGTLGQLPLDYIGPDREPAVWPLFEQPEPGIPRSVTLAKTFEDMLFERHAWWRVLEWGWHGYPTKVRRLDPRSVQVRRDQRVYVRRDGQAQGTAWEWVQDRDLIRFDSPTDGLLKAGSRAIRTCLTLDDAARRHAEGVPPVDYFTESDGVSPFDTKEDAEEFLNAWRTGRRKGSTGLVPGALDYHFSGWNPEQLQMAEARQHAVLEIARLAGVDAEELGVSTTSRTYNNGFERRKQFTDFTLGHYRQAFEDRLSMNDVCPRGYTARLNLSSFLRSDDKTLMEVLEIADRIGLLTKAEQRVMYDRAPLDDAEKAALPAPQPVAEEATADV